MPLLVRFVIAPGFTDDPEKFSIHRAHGGGDVSLSDVHVADGDVMSRMLNSLHHFFAAAVARSSSAS